MKTWNLCNTSTTTYHDDHGPQQPTMMTMLGLDNLARNFSKCSTSKRPRAALG